MSEDRQLITTPEGRFNWVNVFTPIERDKDGKTAKQYEAQIIFEPGVDLSALKKVVSECAFDKWGDKAKKMNLTMPFRDAGEREEYPGYEAGGVFINLNTKKKPRVVDGKRQAIDSDDEFYSGCWGRAAVEPYAYDIKGNRGVKLTLFAIQRSRKDEPLGGGSVNVDTDELFEEIAEADSTSADSLFD